MVTRLVPTGNCWCGCGVDVDLGSFFAPGHDKRAEARLIMEIFGGVPQFLVAFGRGPGGASIASDASWMESAMKLAGMTDGSRAYMALEYPSLDDRAGPLRRIERERVRLQRAELSEGQAVFQVSMADRGPAIVTAARRRVLARQHGEEHRHMRERQGVSSSGSSAARSAGEGS